MPDPPASSLGSPSAADPSQLGDLLAAARPTEGGDPVLAQARVAGRLFGAAEGGLGRFRVLERLGSGGMGVVYAAYDPQLDRGVALKTVHVPTGGRELALQEAKALAKLAHPNVVPVFDVGVEADQVYIVMELVRGVTLRDWVVGKTLREIVDVYRQAGQALAAAHDAHLVHRDFKPDNAIVGLDGRVRVVDFGLACEAADPDSAEPSPSRRVAGTPKYMAPEQRAAGSITPATDQYSFSVALAEALPLPLPGWVEAIVARGRAEQPAARFSSMHELLRALGRDPVRRRRQRIAVAGGAVALGAVAASAFLVGRTQSPSELAACGGGDRELQATWSSAAQRETLARVADLSPYGRSLVELLDGQLSEFRARWLAGHRDACLASRTGIVSERLLHRRMACLDQSRVGLGTVAQIMTRAKADDLPNLARAARAVPDPDACRNIAALTAEVELPSPRVADEVARQRVQLASARVRLAAGNYAEARRDAARVAGLARQLEYRPLRAEALVVEGHALMQTNDDAGAISALREATRLALEVRADDLAVESWARRAWVEGMGDTTRSTALSGVDLIAALATRNQAAFPSALLYNNIGSVELGRGNRAAAKAALARALTYSRQVTGPGAVELVQVRQNLALTVDNPADADQLLQEAHRDLVSLLGANHPDALMVEYIRATVVVTSLPHVAAMLTSLCAKTELHASLRARTAACFVELADVRFELGDRPGAVETLERAVRFGAGSLADTPETSGYAQLWAGHPQRAAESFRAAMQPQPQDAPWFTRYVHGKLLLGLGRALAAQGRHGQARDALQSAVETLEPIVRAHPAVVVERRLGRAHAELQQLRQRQ